MTITHAELLDALAASMSGKGPEHARTVQEMSAEMAMSPGAVRKALAALQAQGRLEVHHVLRPGLSRMARVPAYTILPAAKPKRAK